MLFKQSGNQLMNEKQFSVIRKKLTKTQKQLSELLGVSLQTIHSYEQGRRFVPAHIERQLYFLMSLKEKSLEERKPCWTIKNCPKERRGKCPAWEFNAGKFCWFINGTICECVNQGSWQDKMAFCKNCEVFTPLLALEASQ